MSEHRRRFRSYLSKFRDCYLSVEVRVISGKREGQWRNIWTRIEFSPEEAEKPGQPTSVLCTDFIRADLVTLAVDKAEGLLDGIEQSGTLTLGDVEVAYLNDKYSTEDRGLKLAFLSMPASLGVYEGLPDWSSFRLHATGPDLLNKYLDIDSGELDSHLKTQPTPYLGMADLLSDFGKHHVHRHSPDRTNGVLAIAPVMVGLGKCGCDERKLHVRVEAHPSFTMLPVVVGIIRRDTDDTAVRSSLVADGRDSWTDEGSTAVFAKTIDIQPGDRVNLTLSVQGILTDEESLQERSLLRSHSRLAAHGFFDADLAHLAKLVAGKGKDSNDIEAGIAWLLHLCGFASVRLGTTGIQSEVDVMAFSEEPPSMLAVECTTAPADLSKKLNDLIHRCGGLRDSVGDMPVVPVLFVSGRNYNLSDSDKEEAAEGNVAILDDKDVSELLGKARQGITARDALHFMEERVPASRNNPLGSWSPLGGLPFGSR